MLLFKSELSQLFEVTGLFQSVTATNEFLKNNPGHGVIHEFKTLDLIVVCNNSPSGHSEGADGVRPVNSVKLTDSDKVINIPFVRNWFNSAPSCRAKEDGRG